MNDAWEYLTLPESRTDELNSLGQVGWELVGLSNRPEGSVFYLKRRLPSFRELVTLEQRRTYYASLGREVGATEETLS